ncbi:hypothetical protein ACIBG4_24360 [Nonomuraea sp. NPDC050383]|uniref:hypothetical protein n=1 Tax=Nonomuraea sp. NPDC050383 TaxID=3364362 RepID=UPI003795B66E
MAGPLTTTTGAALAAGFRLAAGLRRGRPLHPHGLLFDAELHLHGDAARTWGSPFLDERLELRGIARLSRSAGLPPPLPDILGIALRWRQADADAELLLATTGHTTPGRRLLRPATRWAPGLYSSLFPYETRGAGDGGGRRVLLGALPRVERPLPARFDALAAAVAKEPLVLDLLVAAPAGPWHLFGLVKLVPPAMADADVPTRFDPTRHPVPGLSPAGRLQELRRPAYTAAQQVPDASAHEGRGGGNSGGSEMRAAGSALFTPEA